MRAKLALVLMLLLSLAWSGCITTRTVNLAKGEPSSKKSASGKWEEIPRKPIPGAYALVPFTLAADVVILPFWVLGTIVGIMPPEM